MARIAELFKNMFLDLFSMGKGFVYGFVMVGLFILIGGVLIYGGLYLKNVVF